MKNLIIFILLGSLSIFHFGVSYRILSKTYYLNAGQQGDRLREGESVKKIISSDLTPKEKIKKLYLNFTTLSGQYHPRFFGLISGICRAIVLQNKENENLEILLGSAAFFLILSISMYKIGELLYDRKIGIFLSFFISFLPIIFPYLRVPTLDLALTAMYTLSIFFLLKTRYFSSSFYSICGGIIWGLSQLTKESFLIFFLPGFLYYIWFLIKKQEKGFSNRVRTNIIISLVLLFLIVGTVYLMPRNYLAIKVYSMKSTLKLYYDGRQSNLLWYIFVFPFVYFYPVIFIAIFPFFIIYLLKMKSEEKALFFLFIIPLFLFSLSPNKSVRFLMPLVPIFVLMCVGGIHKSLKGKTKIIYLSSLLIFSVIQFGMVNFKSPLYLNYYNRIVAKFANFYEEHGILFPFQNQKDKDYLGLSEVFSNMLESEHNKKVIISSTFKDSRLIAVFGKELRRKGIYADYLMCKYDSTNILVSLEKFSNSFEELISKSNYVFDVNNPYVPPCEELKKAFIKNKDLFTLLLEIPMNHEFYGDIKILVYKNRDF